MDRTGHHQPPQKHISVFVFPFSSHPAILLNLVSKLATAAPAVTFSFFSTADSNKALFSKPFPDNIRPYDVYDGVPEDYAFSRKHEENIRLFLAVAEEEFRKSLKVAEAEIGQRISCLVSDCFIWFSGVMAEEMNVPWVAFHTAGTASLSLLLHTDLIRQKLGFTNDPAGHEEEVIDFIPGFSAVRPGDLPGRDLFGNLESPFSVMLHKMARILPKATAVPINCFEELGPADLTNDITSRFNKFLNIGPFNLLSPPIPTSKSDEFASISWLDGQKTRSVAYICFGTVTRLPPHELTALAEALEESKIPFLLSIPSESQKGFPEGFLKRTSANGNGKVVTWAPQVQVLEHDAVGVFLTHCGWNSVLESIGAGVPMICRPFFGDQPINAWMVEKEWEIGVRIEGGIFTKQGTTRALEQVLSYDASGRKFHDKVEALKELAHKAVGPNGSSTENFKNLLDVIASNAL